MIGVIWEITQNYNLWRQSKTQKIPGSQRNRANCGWVSAHSAVFWQRLIESSGPVMVARFG